MKKRFVALALVIVLIFSGLVYGANTRATKIWPDEKAGIHTFFLSNIDIAITQISFKTGTDLSNSKMIVEAVSDTSSVNINDIYQYHAIGKFGIDESSISDIKVYFRVKKDYFESLDANAIISYYYDNGFIISPTEYIDSDLTYYYYLSTPQKLSYFVIAKNQDFKALNSADDNVQMSNELSGLDNVQKNETIAANIFLSMYDDNKKMFNYAFIIGAVLISFIFLFGVIDKIFSGDIYENKNKLVDYIQNRLEEGASKNEIIDELIVQDWPKRIISSAINNVKLSLDTESNIKSYVRLMSDKGKNHEQIIDLLSEQGWDKELISSLVDEI